MIRLFKPGDRVRLIEGGPEMEIIKYISKDSLFFGSYVSNSEVECVWLEDGKRRKRVFHQRDLIKSTHHFPGATNELRESV